jgi:hypothetical protein
MFLVFCTINMQANISIAMVCMVNSTAYTTRVDGNESVTILGHSSPGCMKKENVQDLGMHVIFTFSPHSIPLRVSIYGHQKCKVL